MQIGYRINKQRFDRAEYRSAAAWCNENDASLEDKGEYFEIVTRPVGEITLADYDFAMEEHLKTARIQRGYTTREPSDYISSAVDRWRQDAIDWIAFRDAVLTYALNVQDAVIAGGALPTLEEFMDNMPVIAWTHE